MAGFPRMAIHRDCGSVREMRLGKVSSGVTPSSASRYSRTAREGLADDPFHSTGSSPGALCWLFASAAIRLASTANPSPWTRPAAIQRRTTLSNSQRNTPLSRNRP